MQVAAERRRTGTTAPRRGSRLTPHDAVLDLQRGVGNAAVARAVESGRLQRVPLTGNTATDALYHSTAVVGSNLSWLAGGERAQAYNTPRYGPLSSAGFGTGMYDVLWNGAPGGIPAGRKTGGGTPPNQAWNWLTRRKTANGGAFYVRTHLLSEQLGGLDNWENLVPLTSRGNNPSALSILDQVEAPVIRAVGAGRKVGYRVMPVYSRGPFGQTRTIVNTLLGQVASPWLAELGNLLYYETFIPSELWTSWWYHDSWNPIPSWRRVGNWASPTELADIHFHVHDRVTRPLTGAEIGLLTAGEVAKLALAAAIPAGWPGSVAALAWNSAVSYQPWLETYRLLEAGRVSGVPQALTLGDAARLVERVGRSFTWWPTVIEGLGPATLMLDDPRALGGPRPFGGMATPPNRGGFIPSASTLAAIFGVVRSFVGGRGRRDEL